MLKPAQEKLAGEKFIEESLELQARSLLLREPIPADAPALISFLSVIGHETTFTYNHPAQNLSAEVLSKRLAAENANPLTLRVVAFAGDRPVGQIALWRLNAEHPWLAHRGEFAMMIIKELWGTGLAAALLDRMEAFARTSGVKRIEATVSCTNERGVRLYTRHGFKVEGRGEMTKLIGGESFDSFFIAKILR